ncbi:MAG: CBS domain-containing protein [Deltaproteobacteria bacterium]|nr:CBS domain-containing protein [Deltaproteobacteria bacterium]
MMELGSSTLAQVPTKEPVIVGPDTRLGAVVSALREHRTGAALVVKGGDLIGIFTEHDLMRRVDHSSLAWRDKRVSEVMTARPEVVREDDTLAEALRRMNVGKFRHLPVVRGCRPVGVVSVRDILSLVASKFPADFINLPPSPEKEARQPWGG